MSHLACSLSMPRRSFDPVGRSARRNTIVVLASLLLASHARAATDMRFCDPFMLQGPTTPVLAPERDSAGVLARAWPRPEPGRAPLALTARGSAAGAPSAVWHQLDPLDLGSSLSNLVVDRPRDRLVLFGGYSFTRHMNL